MTDATINIKIDASDSTGTPGGGGTGADADLLARWQKLSEAMARSLDDLNVRAARTSGSGGSPRRPAGGAFDVFSATPDDWSEKLDAEANAHEAGRAKKAKQRGMSFEEVAKAGLAYGGRPPHVSEEDWEKHGKESARRGAGAARIAGKAQEQARKLNEAAEEKGRQEAAQQKRDQEAAEQAKQAQQARYAQMAVTAAMSSGPGKYQQLGGQVGQVAGSAFGARYGPVGAAVGGAVGQKVGEKAGAILDDPLLPLTKAAQIAGEAVRWLGDGAVKVAGNDGVGAFRQAVGLAVDGLEKVPIAGKFAAEGLRTAGKAVDAVVGAVNAFAVRGRELSGLNGPLAASAAKADVTTLLADIREAQQFGPQLGKLIEQQAAFEAVFRELMAPIKSWLIDTLSAIMSGVLKGIEGCLEALNDLTGAAEETLKAVRKILKRLEGDAAGVNLVRMWIAGVDGLAAPGPGVIPAPDAFPPVVAIP